MRKHCASVACQQPVSGFSTLCERHKRNQRRHGHAEQKGVTVLELKPFYARIAARKAKNPSSPTWDLLRGRWEALTGHAKAPLASYSNGALAVSYERQTAQQLVALHNSVSSDDVVDTALAMFLMWESLPNRFQSDKAFAFQLCRRVRGLSDVNKGSHYNVKEGRLKRTYTDVPPRVLGCFGASLKVAFGMAGMRLVELDKKEAEALLSERQGLSNALKDLK